MSSRPVALLHDLIENLNRIPPEQFNLIEPALNQLVREVQLHADARRRDCDVEPLDAALELLYQVRDALWARDASLAVKNALAALRLLG